MIFCKKRKIPCTFRRKCRLTVLFTLSIVLFFTLSVRTSAEAEVYRSVKTDSKKIAITFDDGPHPHQTKQILDILDRYQIKSTFFMVGINVINYPEVAREVIARGHEVGNHTFTHTHLKRLDEKRLSEELGKCEDALEELCEYRPHLFRPPEGAINPYIRHCSENYDYRLILWSIDTRDWESKDAAQIVNTVLEQIQPGDIILMHDYIGRQSKTAEALEVLLPKLLSRGYEPVTVSNLIGIG